MEIPSVTLRDRMNGCWLGKSLGGAVGAPYEGMAFWLDVPKRYPEKPVENDDLDLQLVWLHLLESKGVKISSAELGQGWLEHITYPFDEYGVALTNLKLGLQPPYSGICNNPFYACMGSPIRSEIWACLFPGNPATAGWYAWQDAQVDHWGDGVYGEIFFACLQSAAFVAKSAEEAINVGLRYIPAACGVAKAVRSAVELYHHQVPITLAQKRILADWGDDNFTHALQNIAFTILGLLYGKGDLLDTITLATSCGYDTDCTAATAAAVVGILRGGADMLREAGAACGTEIIAGWGIHDCNPPADTGELTERVLALHPQARQIAPQRTIPEGFTLPELVVPPHPVKTALRVWPAEAPAMAGEPVRPDSARAVTIAGNELPVADWFRDSGLPVLCLQSGFYLPEPRRVRVLPVFAGEERLWLDGKLILDQKKWRPYLPAPHRCSTDSPLLTLEKGWHRLTVAVSRPGVREEVPFSLLLAHESHHLMADVPFCLPPVEVEVGV